MSLNFDFDMHVFLGLDDSAAFHCMLCLFVSGVYWKTQVSFFAIIWLRISGLSSIFSSISSQNLTQFCFWSSDKILGTILAHTFCIPRSCSKTICTDSLLRLSSSDIICTVNLQSLHTSSFTLVMFSFVLVGRLSHLGIIPNFLWPFLKCLCHSKICILDITSTP